MQSAGGSGKRRWAELDRIVTENRRGTTGMRDLGEETGEKAGERTGEGADENERSRWSRRRGAGEGADQPGVFTIDAAAYVR
ncbi:hypothetical protein GCM10009564_48750 [Streptomyces thermogriseus]|uniref:Uncharacterized protein n=1 Tax=Streptomyces thermogriseus TaxID=75292 RepID=A0ABN1T5I4_9ACTN